MERLKDKISLDELVKILPNKINKINIIINHTKHTVRITGLLYQPITTYLEVSDLIESIKGSGYAEFNKKAVIRKKNGWNPNGYLEKVLCPSFVKFFWILVSWLGTMPTPIEYMDFYHKCCLVDKGEETFDFQPWCDYKKPERKGIILPQKTTLNNIDLLVRINNLYCGFIRELTFGELCQPIFNNMQKTKIVPYRLKLEVVHNLTNDIFNDKDLELIIRSIRTGEIRKVCFALYDQTPRTREKRLEKLRRKQDKIRDYDLHLGIPAYIRTFNKFNSNTYEIEKVELYQESTIEQALLVACKNYKGEYEMDCNYNLVDLEKLIKK